MLVVTPRIAVSDRELSFDFVRSSGAGGQNVNKVNSKAILRWMVADSLSLPIDVKRRLLKRLGRRLTLEGELVISSQRYRDQHRNIRDCLDKLRLLILEAATPPKKRVATKPSRTAKAKRLATKQLQGEKKQQRRIKDWEQ